MLDEIDQVSLRQGKHSMLSSALAKNGGGVGFPRGRKGTHSVNSSSHMPYLNQSNVSRKGASVTKNHSRMKTHTPKHHSKGGGNSMSFQKPGRDACYNSLFI